MKTVPCITAKLCAAVVLSLTISACSGQGSSLASPTSPGGVLAADAVLAQKQAATGCPAVGNPGGNPGLKVIGVLTIADAAARWSAQITDAWYVQNGYVKEEFLAGRLEFATSIDKNGDGLLCVAQNWGENLNPNSHWALIFADTLDPPATEAWFLSDNHVGTSQG